MHTPVYRFAATKPHCQNPGLNRCKFCSLGQTDAHALRPLETKGSTRHDFTEAHPFVLFAC